MVLSNRSDYYGCFLCTKNPTCQLNIVQKIEFKLTWTSLIEAHKLNMFTRNSRILKEIHAVTLTFSLYVTGKTTEFNFFSCFMLCNVTSPSSLLAFLHQHNNKKSTLHLGSFANKPSHNSSNYLRLHNSNLCNVLPKFCIVDVICKFFTVRFT